jgi:type II secretory pathway component PulK
MKRLSWLKIHKRSGSALVTVMIIFAVLMIMSATIMTLFSTNLKQSKYQEDKLRSYYLAQSGIELGYASLMTVVSTPPDVKFISSFTGAGNIGKVMTDTIDLSDGTVVLTIQSMTDADGKVWISITSVGTLTGTNISTRTRMKFMADNYAVIIRDAG